MAIKFNPFKIIQKFIHDVSHSIGHHKGKTVGHKNPAPKRTPPTPPPAATHRSSVDKTMHEREVAKLDEERKRYQPLIDKCKRFFGKDYSPYSNSYTKAVTDSEIRFLNKYKAPQDTSENIKVAILHTEKLFSGKVLLEKFRGLDASKQHQIYATALFQTFGEEGAQLFETQTHSLQSETFFNNHITLNGKSVSPNEFKEKLELFLKNIRKLL